MPTRYLRGGLDLRPVDPGLGCLGDLRDIRVLRTSPEGLNGKLPTGAGQSYSILVAVTDTQVQKLFYVMKNADWSLELRPIVDAADSAEHVETAGSVLTAGTGRNR